MDENISNQQISKMLESNTVINIRLSQIEHKINELYAKVGLLENENIVLRANIKKTMLYLDELRKSQEKV